MNRLNFLAYLFFASFLIGCGGETVQSDLRTVSMTIGSKQFTLEVADSMAAQEHGLMQRDSMPTLHGMIFVFADETEHNFYMKNTRIPLDILFLAHDGRIISMATMQPYDLSLTPSGGPAKYAIELNAGAIKEAGVRPGQVLDVPADAREPKH